MKLFFAACLVLAALAAPAAAQSNSTEVCLMCGCDAGNSRCTVGGPCGISDWCHEGSDLAQCDVQVCFCDFS